MRRNTRYNGYTICPIAQIIAAAWYSRAHFTRGFVRGVTFGFLPLS
jgi:hypothetical protein